MANALNANQSTVSLTSRTTSNLDRTESESSLPSSSHETHYVPLLTSDQHNHNNNNTTVMIPTTTPTTLRPTVTTTINDSSLTSSTYCRTLLAFVFVYFVMILNWTVLAIIHERVPRSQPALPDMAFDILPTADWALDVVEWLVLFEVMGLVLLIFLNSVIIFRRLCVILGVLYLFLTVCMASTQLPIANKDYYCSPQLKNATDPSADPIRTTGQYILIIAERVFYMNLDMGLSIFGRHSYCGDYMFSGHTVVLTIAYLFFREYPPRSQTWIWKFIHLLLICISLAGVICILIVRQQYFMNIIIQCIATTVIFWIYHMLCNNNALRSETSTNCLSRVWWWEIFIYFESDHVLSCPSDDKSDSQVAQMLPRFFEWPLPWPRFLQQRFNN